MLVLALFLGVFSICIMLIVKFLYWKVQCWFCGYTTRASWSRKTSFVCQQCGQYNGFKSDGDYNKVIPSQYIAELNPINFHQVRGTFSSHSDVLCLDCTRNQNIIIQKLSEYNPKDDKSDEEIKEYTRQLELKYSLCSGCYRKVNDKLRQLDCKLLPSFIAWWHNHNSNNKHRTMSTMKNPTSLKTTHRPQGLAAWFELFVILRIISILCFVSIITGPFLTEITKQTCLIQIPTNQSHLYKFIELFWSNQCRHYSRQYCPLMIIYAQHFSLSITGQMWFTCLLFCLQFLIVIRTGWRIRSQQQQQPYYSRCRRRHRHYSMYHDGLKSLILLYDISMLLISINILLPSILTMDSKLMKLILSNNSFIIHVACFSVILIFLLFIVIAYGTKIWLSFFLKDFLSQQKQLKTKWPIHTTTNNNNSSNNITFTTSRSINDGDDNTMSYYSTPSSNCQSLNSSRKSLEDQLAATKLYTTSNYSNQTVFRPSVLTTNHHSQTSSPRSNSCSSCSSSSIIDSQRYSTTHSPHSFISSNHFNNNNRMKQHHQNMQLQSYPCNEEDTLSVLSYRNNPCKLKHDPTMDYHHADQCHHHHHHDPVSDDYSFMHSLSEVAAAAKRKSSHSSLKRKRRTGLIHFILCLLFGRLETWKDVCYELTCLANAIFLSIIIYCTCRIMFCLMNTFGI